MNTTDINQIIEIPNIQLIPRNVEEEQKLNSLSTYAEKYQYIIEYYRNIDQSILDGIYCEIHHIVPKSCDGSNDLENLVKVPGGIHYILHCLLPNVYIEQNKFRYYQKAIFAWDRLRKSSNKHKCLLNINEESLEYQELQKIHKQILSNKQRERFSDPKERQKISNLNKIRYQSEEERKKCSCKGEKNGMFGRRDDMSPASKMMWIKNEETGESKYIKRSDVIPNGWIKGRINPYDRKIAKKIMITNEKVDKLIPISQPIPNGWKRGSVTHKGSAGKHWITNGIESHLADKNLPIPNGWHLGNHYTKNCGGAITRGMFWINDGYKSKLCKGDIPNGWTKGHLFRKHNKRK